MKCCKSMGNLEYRVRRSDVMKAYKKAVAVSDWVKAQNFREELNALTHQFWLQQETLLKTEQEAFTLLKDELTLTLE